MTNKITCFISYSHDNKNLSKFERIDKLVSNSNHYINYSEKMNISTFSDETIWNYLYSRISGSSCTLVLLTEDLFTYNKQKIDYKINDFINSGWIYNEISVSLGDWTDNRINGIVCIVEDSLIDKISVWNKTIYGYKLPEILKKNKEYIIFVSYSDFIINHLKYIDMALKNREEQISSGNKAFKIKYNLHTSNDF